MKQLIGAAILAIASTGAASAYDNYSGGQSGYGHGNDYYAAEKQDGKAWNERSDRRGIKISEDPNPSKLKRQLEFFKQFSGRD